MPIYRALNWRRYLHVTRKSQPSERSGHLLQVTEQSQVASLRTSDSVSSTCLYPSPPLPSTPTLTLQPPWYLLLTLAWPGTFTSTLGGQLASIGLR